MRSPLLPLAALLVLPLAAAQAKPATHPGAQPGPQAIGPKPDDPRQAKGAQSAPKADPRKGGARR